MGNNNIKFIILTTIPNSLNFFKNQINGLNEIYDVTLISSPSPLLKEIADREHVNYKGIEMKREISIISDLISLLKLIIYFISYKPQIIHCNTPKASLLGLIAGYLTRVPNRIYYIHGFRYEGTFGFKRKLLIGMEKISCFCATNIIAVSHGIKQTAQKEITNKNIAVIHNGSANGMVIENFLETNYNNEKTRNELNIQANDFVYGFVGRIVGDKGINELVESFNELNKIHNNIKLILVGNYEENLDPIKESTKYLIKSNLNIIETGFQKDVKKYLSIIDVFVSPSYREGFGLSLLEANLMQVPVIASNITGYNEIIREGKNGFLIPSKNKDALQNKMDEVYVNRHQLIEMKSFCRENAIKKYNHNDVLAQALKYYKNLHSEKNVQKLF
ncbi:glycosyltransferase family 4 protein [Empedobacter falsenii]|uniref:glycosyltransferase family 4 protein n=1 Tax=Empedobacter falsenii TaxID=343874 RepID=UPI001C570EE1|nr:glycosyltransferase family 4 protein [Empedobacter falsenii]MBW1619748.1 glycosyltransferase family 4 protein [Empedobacter falsenii]